VATASALSFGFSTHSRISQPPHRPQTLQKLNRIPTPNLTLSSLDCVTLFSNFYMGNWRQLQQQQQQKQRFNPAPGYPPPPPPATTTHRLPPPPFHPFLCGVCSVAAAAATTTSEAVAKAKIH